MIYCETVNPHPAGLWHGSRCWWDVPLYVTGRGVTTSPMHHGEQICEIQLDYLAHELRVDSVDSRSWRRSLLGLSVADFTARSRPPCGYWGSKWRSPNLVPSI